MGDGSNESDPIGSLGHLAKVFADLDAGNNSVDGAEFAAVLDGGVGLHVPGILLGRSTPHEKEDAPLRFAEPRELIGRAISVSRLRLGFEQMGQGRPQKRKAADTKEFAPTDWISSLFLREFSSLPAHVADPPRAF